MSYNCHSKRWAFTLIEVLLVVAIIGIISLVSMPYLVHSIRGNRLRTAARTVVMAGRYARSMALLKQQEVRLIINLERASVEVKIANSTPPPVAKPATNTTSTISDSNIASGGAEPPPAMAMQNLDVARTLEDIKIEYVKTEHQEQIANGVATIVYYANGRCEPYAIRIVDERGSSVLVTVNALSTAKTENES